MVLIFTLDCIIKIIVCWLFTGLIHPHEEPKSASFVYPIRFDIDGALAELYYLFDYRQTKANSFMIHRGRPVQLTKSREKFWQVFGCNTSSSVTNMSDQGLTVAQVSQLYLDRACGCEFQRVLNQVE